MFINFEVFEKINDMNIKVVNKNIKIKIFNRKFVLQLHKINDIDNKFINKNIKIIIIIK